MKQHEGESPLYKILLGTSLLVTLAGIATLLPLGHPSKPNVLGYRSLCTFAPMASFACFAIAALCCTIRANYFGPERQARAYKSFLGRHRIALAVIVILGSCIAVGAASFQTVQTAFFQSISTLEKSAVAGQTAIRADGTYAGKESSEGVEVEVSVTLAGGKISAVQLVGSKNFDTALHEALQEKLKAAGTPEGVDAVSGATFSSDVWLNAVKKAVQP